MLRNLAKRLLPPDARLRLRVASEAMRLPPERLRMAHEIIGSGIGLYGEPFRFLEDGIATIHNADFLTDPRFEGAYQSGAATGSWAGWANRWRAYIACWCAQQTSHLPGDFVECGVNKGGNPRMIIDYLGPDAFCRRRFYLLDTFEGFDDRYLSEKERETRKRFHYSSVLSEVETTFSPYPFATIVQGPVPDTLSKVASNCIAFVSIDMNCVAPELAAAEYFWERMSAGAILLLDDYGFSNHEEQKMGFDAFAAARAVAVLQLPTGQGMIIKPPPKEG
jgi:hypothetical protein